MLQCDLAQSHRKRCRGCVGAANPESHDSKHKTQFVDGLLPGPATLRGRKRINEFIHTPKSLMHTIRKQCPGMVRPDNTGCSNRDIVGVLLRVGRSSEIQKDVPCPRHTRPSQNAIEKAADASLTRWWMSPPSSTDEYLI